MATSAITTAALELSAPFQVGEWLAEPELNQLRSTTGEAAAARLEPKVMELLVYLASRQGRTITRRELLDAVWGERFVVEAVLTRCVFELRQALADDPQSPRYIQTVPKKGYRWIAPVDAAPAAAAPEREARPPADGEAFQPDGVVIRRRSLAVLPFADVGPAPPAGSKQRNAHLAVGLADATIAELASIRELIVRPTSAVLRYQRQDAPIDPQQAGRELGVEVVLAGTFQRQGPRLRVTVRLIATADGRSLWAAKINTSLDDLFEMEDEVSRNIARALEVELAPASARSRAARPAGEVYELYLEGRIHLLRETLEECLAALDSFDKACTADPAWALAWAGLADAYSRIAFTFLPEGDWYARAWSACEKALALDPDLPEARCVRGGRLIWSPHGGFDHAAALRDLVPALMDRPSLEDAHVRLGVILHHVGLIDEVEDELARVLTFSPDHFMARQHQALCLMTRGRYDQALQIYEAAARVAPNSWVNYQLALCLLHIGQLERAAAAADLMARLDPRDVLQYPLRGLIAALQGDAAEGRRQALLTEENRRAFGHYHHAQYDIACIHAVLGDRDQALLWLGQAARNGFPCHPQFANDPLLASLRGDQRFERLLEELREESTGYARLYRELRRPRAAFSARPTASGGGRPKSGPAAAEP